MQKIVAPLFKIMHIIQAYNDYRNKFSPVVEDLRDLSSCLVSAITAQTAGAEGESNSIRTLHCGHPTITIGCAAAIVS